MKKANNAYAEKLKDPRWQKKRLEILSRDEFVCQSCFSDTKTLHVHHRRYLPGKEPWDIPNDLLVTLCEICHQEETDTVADACHDLVAIAKQKFFASDIQELSQALLNMPIYCDTHVTAAVILHWIGDRERFIELGEKYFDHLKKENGRDQEGTDSDDDDIGF